MREIKFRLWDVSGRYFLKWDEVQECTVQDILGGFNRWAKPQQYTGLKDRNGKEIYEGDVIAVPIRKRGSILNFVVEFFEGAFRAINPHDSTDVFQVSEICDCGVIGNVHENPELGGK